MKTLKWTILVIVGLGVLVLAVSQLLPAKWQVQRSIVVMAPPGAILPYVANLKTGWPQWSAFDTEDPDIQYSYSGPDEGPGAKRSWTSKKMGAGSQSIVKADAQGVEFELHMDKGDFAMKGNFAFEPAMGGTRITWTDSGEVGRNPMYRFMASFLDKMMGSTFETSLQALKVKVEHPPKA
jgi:hypothetical protein